MEKDEKVLVVDDDSFTHELFDVMLAEKYRLLHAETGRDALRVAAAERPDLILLDVELPDLDGYQVCRRLRDDGSADVPLIFVSGCDGIEDRLRGYEAGGDDYVLKPFEQQELLAKVTRLLNVGAERRNLSAMASNASQTAMTAMTSMSEMGALLQSLQSFNGCQDHAKLADAVIAGLRLYDLSGVVQIRAAAGMLTRSEHGPASPLEASVVAHMAGMERIVQFKNRLAVNYPHVTLMVNDMPLHDTERCGRLRDHLAVLAESAEVRVGAIDGALASRRRDDGIRHVIDEIVGTLGEIDAAQRQSRTDTQLAIDSFNSRMVEAYAVVALSGSQEDMMNGVVATGLEAILDAQSAEIDLQDRLSTIIAELRGIVADHSDS